MNDAHRRGAGLILGFTLGLVTAWVTETILSGTKGHRRVYETYFCQRG
jgi:hypothetical protein